LRVYPNVNRHVNRRVRFRWDLSGRKVRMGVESQSIGKNLELLDVNFATEGHLEICGELSRDRKLKARYKSYWRRGICYN